MRTSFYVKPTMQRTDLSKDEAVSCVSTNLKDLGYAAKVFPAINVMNQNLIDGCVVEVANADDETDKQVDDRIIRMAIGLRKEMSDFPMYLLLKTKGDPVLAFRRTIFEANLNEIALQWFTEAERLFAEKGIFVSVFIHQVNETQVEINGFSVNQEAPSKWQKAAESISSRLGFGIPKFVNRRVLPLQEN